MVGSGLEVIAVGTSPTKEIDNQRAIAGARKYYENNQNKKVIISGQMDYEGDWNMYKYGTTQSGKIYRALRKDGVPREKITIESKSKNTRGNVIYSYDLVKDENPEKIVFATDRLHGTRFRLIYWFEKFYNRAKNNIKTETYSEGIDKAYGLIKSIFAIVKDFYVSLLSWNRKPKTTLSSTSSS